MLGLRSAKQNEGMKEMLNRAHVVVIIESVTHHTAVSAAACSRAQHQHWPAGEIFKHMLGVAAVSGEEAGHWHGAGTTPL